LGKQNKFKCDPKLQADDVISISSVDVFNRNSLILSKTFQIVDIEEKVLQKILQNADIQQLKDGVEAELLSPNNPWRKGKVKLQIECKFVFTPEEESGE
jgi:hypothetical protein